MKKFGLETKVVITVILFVLFISFFERYQMTSNLKEQLIESEKDRNQLLIKTISPIISINLSLGLDEANKEYLDEIVKQNSDILTLTIIDYSDSTIYNYTRQNKEIKENTSNYFSHNIIDNLTGDKLAHLKLNTSRDRYNTLIQTNNKTTINIFLITFIILLIFIITLKKEFVFLRNLTNNITKYNPEKNNFPLKESFRYDEVGIIHNAIIGMIKKIHSYTELLQTAQDEREKASLILAQQSKMAYLGEMLASITHQWRQPLSVISAINVKLQIGSSQKTISHDTINKDAKNIEAQLEYMTQTLEDFSSFFKPDKESIKFSPKDSIESILKLFGHEYTSHNIKININQKTTANTSTILGYNNEFRQVILNILSNAKDEIVKNNIQKRGIDILIESTKKNMKISIQDYAGGIDNSIKDKLFKPYITTKSTDKGTGIGLYMSKQIIEESMHGKLEVSNQNSGALFMITLPLNIEKHNEL